MSEELALVETEEAREPTAAERRAAQRARARRAWRALVDSILGITPSALARFLLVIGVIGAIFWVLSHAWTALIPFQFGIVLAYLMLPLVNRFSRRMPRWAAILLTFGSGLLLIFIAVAFLIPPLSEQIGRLINSLPNSDDIEQWVAQLRLLYEGLPDDWKARLDSATVELVIFLQNNIAAYLRTTFTFLATTALNLFKTATFLFGFLVVPFWLFFVLNDYHPGVKAFDRLLAPWLRNDIWAVLRIVDNIFSKYIRGQLLLGLIIGITSYVGLTILKMAGFGGIQYELLLAIFAGITELVPLIGPILGSIPAIILGFSDSWQSGLAITLLYIGIQQLENSLLVPRVQGESIEIHPAILSMTLVALSQFGFIWLILSAPLVAIIRDLVRYVYGRLDDPPMPAGKIPGEE